MVFIRNYVEVEAYNEIGHKSFVMIVKIGHMLLIIQPLLLGIWMKFSDKQSLFERLTRHMVLSSFLKKNNKKKN